MQFNKKNVGYREHCTVLAWGLVPHRNHTATLHKQCVRPSSPLFPNRLFLFYWIATLACLDQSHLYLPLTAHWQMYGTCVQAKSLRNCKQIISKRGTNTNHMLIGNLMGRKYLRDLTTEGRMIISVWLYSRYNGALLWIRQLAFRFPRKQNISLKVFCGQGSTHISGEGTFSLLSLMKETGSTSET
jgi:hypothetical protein